MNDIREILDHQLRQGNLDVMDIVPIPMHGDRMLRLRTIEEAIDDFGAQGDSVSYLIQVKNPRAPHSPPPPPSVATAPAPAGIAAPAVHQRPSAATASSTGENIYLNDGKLNVPYLARNAELLLAAREYALARNIFQSIAASGERTGMALFGVGRCDEAEGRFEEARRHYEEAIAYHATLDAYHRLSHVLILQKKDGLAAEALERALSLRDLEAKTRFELHKACGNSFLRARAHDQAQRHYRKALELDPAADDIRSNLGALHLQAQQLDEAKRNFEDALASNPRNDKALSGLASCYLAAGDKRRAHDTLVKSLEVNLNNPTAIFHLVKCAYDIRSYAAAARVVEEYVQVAPVNVNLLYSLAGLQFHLGRQNDARMTAQRILTLNAEHSGARELLKLIERRPS